MGLDHGLQAELYVKNWPHMSMDRLHFITTEGPNVKIMEAFADNISYITYDLITWRKENHIHAWFVDHCNGGEDNNGKFFVNKEEFIEFILTCEVIVRDWDKSEKTIKDVYNGITWEKGVHTVLTRKDEVAKDINTAKALMPTRSGFFFGSTEYDKYYIESLRHALKTFKPLIENEQFMKQLDWGITLQYWASW